MMNKMPTSKAAKLRLLIVLPLAVALLFAFRNAEPTLGDIDKKESIITPDTQDVNKKLLSDHISFLKRNPDVVKLYWIHEDILDKNSRIARVVLELKDAQFENYHLDNKKEMAAFEKQYGKLPKVPTLITQQTGNPDLPKELVDLLKQNPAIKSVRGRTIDNKPAIVISLKGGGTEVYYLNDAKSIAELERKYKLPELPPPPPPAPDTEELPAPPPPVPAEEQLPPPPVKHKKLLVPYSGAKLVEDAEAVTYILWPDNVTSKEFEVARQAFAENGFDLKFKEYKGQDGGDTINITIASKKLNTGTSSVHNLKDLASYNNVVVVRGFKESGEFFIGTTIPPDK